MQRYEVSGVPSMVKVLEQNTWIDDFLQFPLNILTATPKHRFPPLDRKERKSQVGGQRLGS